MRERHLKPGEMEVVVAEASSPNKQFVSEKEVNVRQNVITFKENCDKNYFKNVNQVKFVKKTPPFANNEDITLDSTFTNGISDCHWPKAAESQADRRGKLKARSELTELCVEDEKEEWVTQGRVLSMSLVKLREDQNLHKTVVINNTVRIIEDQIKRDILKAFKLF